MRACCPAPIFLLAACSTGTLDAQDPPHASTPANAQLGMTQDQRMEWWREARFGMFIHWGLYAIPAGEWKGEKGYGEWIRDSAHIPVGTYDKFQPQWNPVNFDADAWAKMAADAGMKYLVLTSKHHDGFCLFDSKQTEWDVMNTPFGRDVCKELAAACERHGVRFCTYHSIMDWHHPDYLPRRPWEKAERSEDGAAFTRYEKYLHAQVTEVIQNYHPAVMWFDGEWESTWNHERGLSLFELCRSLAPAMLVNNRVDVHRGGMGGFNGSNEAVGDFATPEQEIPATGIPGVDWESCMTMNSHWGWNQADPDWKSTKTLLHNLIDIASKGGNYLLNIGPRADGTFPPQAVERLAEIGAWMKGNGEAISGTTASVFDSLPWGRCTVRRAGATTKLYLHVFDWPDDGTLMVPGLGNEVQKAYLLEGPQTALDCLRKGANVGITLPSMFVKPTMPSVVVLEVKGAPVVYKTPTITAETGEFVTSVAVTVASASPELEIHYTLDGSEPSAQSPVAKAPLAVTTTCTVKAIAFHQGKPVSEVVARTFTKVEPAPPVEPVAPNHGVHVAKLNMVEWSKIPDNRKDFLVDQLGTAPQIQLGKAPGEHVAVQWTGFLDVPKDELYRFALSSDDGSKLWIDGQVVVDNDGLHGSVEKQGTRALGKGLHTIEVVWFNATGGAELKLRWALPGGTFEEIPASALRY
jgi:alpha-L-fucosidase